LPESEVARVTSKKSESSRSSRKAPETLDSKSFQRRQKFSEVPIVGALQIWLEFGVGVWNGNGWLAVFREKAFYGSIEEMFV